MSDNQPLILTYGADAKALDAAMNRSLTKVIATMDKMEARVTAFEKRLAGMGKTFSGGKVVNEIKSIEDALARVGRTDAGKALANVFDRSRLAVLEQGAAKIPIFGSALADLGPAGLAAGVGIAAAAAAIEGAFKFTEKAAEIERTAKALGMTTTQVQEFAHVATSLNIAPDKLNESLAGLQRTIGLVESGLARSMSTKAFTEGLKIDPAALRSWGTLEQQLPHILDAAAKLNTEERSGLASRLKIDPEVLNSLVEGRSHLTDLISEAHRYGLVVDADVVKKGAEANEKLKTAGDIIKTNLTVAFADLAPVIVRVANAIASATSNLNDFIQNFKKLEDRNSGALEFERAQLQADDKDLRDANPGIRMAPQKGQSLANRFSQNDEDYLRAINNRQVEIDQLLNVRAAADAKAAKDAAGAPATQVDSGTHHAHADHSAAEISDAEVRYKEALIRGAKDLEEAHQLRLQLIQAQYSLALAHAAQEKRPDTRATLVGIAGLTEAADTADENQRYQQAQTDHQRTFTDELDRLHQGQLEAQAGITGQLQDRQAADRARLQTEQDQAAIDTAAKVAKLAQEKGDAGREEGARVISAQASEFLAQIQEQRTKQAKETADQDTDNELRTLGFDKQRLEALEKLATTQAARRALAEEVLKVEQRQAELELEKQYRNDPAALASAQSALGLDFKARGADLAKQNEGPAAKFADANNISNLGTELQDNAVKAMESLNSGLAEAIANGKSLHDVLKKAEKDFVANSINSGLKAGEGSLFQSLGAGGGGSGVGALSGVSLGGGMNTSPGSAGGLLGLMGGIFRIFGFAGGGQVPGSGHGDHVPALLEPGERVIRNGPSQRYATFLDALNTGSGIAHFAAGGVVGNLAVPSGAAARSVSLNVTSHADVRGAAGDREITRIVQASHDHAVATMLAALPDVVPGVVAQSQLQSG